MYGPAPSSVPTVKVPSPTHPGDYTERGFERMVNATQLSDIYLTSADATISYTGARATSSPAPYQLLRALCGAVWAAASCHAVCAGADIRVAWADSSWATGLVRSNAPSGELCVVAHRLMAELVASFARSLGAVIVAYSKLCPPEELPIVPILRARCAVRRFAERWHVLLGEDVQRVTDLATKLKLQLK